MNKTNLRSKRKILITSLVAVFALALFSGATVSAQVPWWGQGGYGGYGGYGRNDRNRDWRRGNSYEVARSRGYEDGMNVGSEDSYRRQSFDPQRSHYYRSATDGYNSSFGNKNAYKDAFREGFLRGYREGYQRNGRGNHRF